MKRSLSVVHSAASSWVLLGVSTVSQLVQVPIALHFLDTQEFGLFALLSQFINTLMLVQLGVTSALTRLFVDGLAQGREAYNRIWSSGLCIFGIQGGVIAAVVLATTPFLSHIFQIPPDLARTATWLFLAMGAYGVAGYVTNIYAMALVAGQRMATSNITSLAGVVLQLALFVGALWSGMGIWAYVMANLVTLPVGLFLNWKLAKHHGLLGEFRKMHIRRKELFDIFRLGLDVFVAGCFNMFMTSAILLFSGALLTLQATALLAVNLKLPLLLVNLFQRIPGSAGPALSERVSHDDLGRFRFGWTFITKLTLAVAAAGTGLYFLWSRLVVALWTSQEMVLPPVPTLLLALIPMRFILHYLLVMMLSVFKELRIVRWPLAAEVVICAVLMLFLGRQFGLTGLLVANVVSVFTGSIWFGARALARLGGMRLGDVLAVTARSLAVPGLLLALAAMLYSPPSVFAGMPVLLTITAAWSLVNGLHFWRFSLTPGEREHFGRLIGQILGRNL